jgi:hypothetical protein
VDLANVNAPPGLRPPAPVVRAELLADRIEEREHPVVLTTTLTAAMLERPTAQGRQQSDSVTVGWGMTRPWPDHTGAHGIIPDAPPLPNMAGGQEPWRSWNPHTLRHAPTEPWDAGVTQGNAQ